MNKTIQIHYNHLIEPMFALAEQAGFQYVSLGFGSNKEDFILNDWEQISSKINQLLEQYHLTCIQTHLPYYDLRISAEELDEEMEIAIKRCIKTSAQLGAKQCVYHPRSAVNQNYSSRVALKVNHDVISDYVEIGKKEEIGIALENLPIFPGIHEMRFYTHDYEDLCELVDSFHDPIVSVCWDFGHAYLTQIDQVLALRTIGNRLSCTHMHNNFLHSDNHLPPLLGWMDWKPIMPILKEINYSGPLTLEVDYTPL